jgi:hypothetical protein
MFTFDLRSILSKFERIIHVLTHFLSIDVNEIVSVHGGRGRSYLVYIDDVISIVVAISMSISVSIVVIISIPAVAWIIASARKIF